MKYDYWIWQDIVSEWAGKPGYQWTIKDTETDQIVAESNLVQPGNAARAEMMARLAQLEGSNHGILESLR